MNYQTCKQDVAETLSTNLLLYNNNVTTKTKYNYHTINTYSNYSLSAASYKLKNLPLC